MEQYKVVGELGKGATAIVYLAIDTTTDKKVCLKVFHGHITNDKQHVRRIKREFEVVRDLNHPNIVKASQFIDVAEKPFIVFDYIEGENLEKFQSKLPYVLPEVSVLVVIEILKALEFSHSRNVIHRDLKPENILIQRDGHVFVTDFGLAKVQEQSTLITRPDQVIGTFEYMSPEQSTGQPVSHLSDLFSVGAIFYFLVTGTRPFSRGTPLQTLKAIQEEKEESPEKRNPKLSIELSRILQKSLAKKPEDRFASATEFRHALEHYLEKLDLRADHFNLGIWLENPANRTYDALRSSIDSLNTLCAQNLKSKNWAHLMELIAHLSLKAPESKSIHLYLDAMESGQTLKRVRWFAIGGLVLIVLSTGGFLIFRSGHAPQTPVSMITETLATPSPSAPPSVPVEFKLPPDVQVFWDGRLIPHQEPFLEPQLGEHDLVLKKRGFSPIRKKIWVKANEPVIIQVQ